MIKRSKRSFYRSVNAIFVKILSTATVDVVLHLINFKGLPVLLYGLEVSPLNRADIQSLDFCVNRLLMKLFCTTNLSMIEELLRKRTVKFLRKLNDHRG